MGGRARTKAAATVGLSENTAEKGLAVLNLAEKGDERATAAIGAISRGETSIDRAYREFVRGDEEDLKSDEADSIALDALDEAEEFLAKAARSIKEYVSNRDSIVDKKEAEPILRRIKDRLRTLLIQLVEDDDGKKN